jgi:hypothetical protein
MLALWKSPGLLPVALEVRGFGLEAGHGGAAPVHDAVEAAWKRHVNILEALWKRHFVVWKLHGSSVEATPRHFRAC